MRNAERIAAMSNQVRLAVLSLTLVLTMAVPRQSPGAEQPGSNEAGQHVVPKRQNFTLRADDGGAERPAKIAIYRVDRVKGGALQLKAEGGASGWVEASQVVPVGKAVEYFTSAIKEFPRDPYNYTMRAMVLLFERGHPPQATRSQRLPRSRGRAHVER